MAACATSAAVTTTATPPGASVTTTTSPIEAGTTTSSVTTALPTAEVTVGGSSLTVWVADEPDERQQGLRGVARLPGGVDGMLFVFPEPAVPTFVMMGALIPLDLWFFDAEGALVGSAEMEPCPEEPCSRYQAPGPVSWGLETPLGAHDFVTGDLLSTSDSG